MEKQLFKNIKNAVKHWYLSLIVGILFLLFGFWILKTPMESYITLALLFGVIFCKSAKIPFFDFFKEFFNGIIIMKSKFFVKVGCQRLVGKIKEGEKF